MTRLSRPFHGDDVFGNRDERFVLERFVDHQPTSQTAFNAVICCPTQLDTTSANRNDVKERYFGTPPRKDDALAPLLKGANSTEL